MPEIAPAAAGTIRARFTVVADGANSRFGRALGTARRLAPWSGSLGDAHRKLLDYESRVAKAQSGSSLRRSCDGGSSRRRRGRSRCRRVWR